MDGLIDTSAFVAREAGREAGRELGPLPDRAAISVITIAELHVGAIVAIDDAIRARRMRTLSLVERAFDAIPVDAAIARRFAEIVAAGRRMGLRFQVTDALIGATALELGVPVYTQDGDFERMPGVVASRL